LPSRSGESLTTNAPSSDNSNLDGIRHRLELRLTKIHIRDANWITRVTPLSLFSEVFTDYGREPRKVSGPIPGPRPQASLIPQVAKAPKYFVLAGARGSIHHIHDVAQLWVDPLILWVSHHVERKRIIQSGVLLAGLRTQPGVQPRIAFFAIRGWIV